MKEIKIAIVGCEENEWKPEQIPKVKQWIKNMFHALGFDNVLVSGHCPKGGVDIWAEEIADELGIKKEIYPAEVNQWNDKKSKDIFVCNFDGCTFEGSEGEIYKHSDETGHMCINVSNKILKGYRSRNIQIAEACDVLCCIVPWVNIEALDNIHEDEPPPFPITLSKNQYCIYCKQIGHPTNGGCWTMKKARQLGKEVHLVMVE